MRLRALGYDWRVAFSKFARIFPVIVIFLTLGVAKAQLGPCTIETVAGGGPVGRGDGGSALKAEFSQPGDLAQRVDGSLYVTDPVENIIRRVRPDGTIERFAGTGINEVSGDGGPAVSAGLRNPLNPAVGPDGSVYFRAVGPRVRPGPQPMPICVPQQHQ